MIQRGDLVTVALQGDFCKAGPALVVQSNLLNELESVIVCPVSSELRTVAFRVTLEPTPANGLKVVSQVMVDKIITLLRTEICGPFGRLEEERIRFVDRTLLLVLCVI